MPGTMQRAKAETNVHSRAKVTSKGQITLPIALRRQLGVKAGDSIVFKTKGRDVVIVPQGRESVFAKYRGIGTPGIGPGKKAVLAWVREVRGEL